MTKIRSIDSYLFLIVSGACWLATPAPRAGANAVMQGLALRGYCGDGRRVHSEACDPGLSATCGSDCTERGTLIECVTSAECPSGQSCGIDNAVSYGVPASGRLCWPSLCDDSASRRSSCGDESAACGVCVDEPPCGDDHCALYTSTCSPGEAAYCENTCGTATGCDSASACSAVNVCQPECGCHLRCTDYEPRYTACKAACSTCLRKSAQGAFVWLTDCDACGSTWQEDPSCPLIGTRCVAWDEVCAQAPNCATPPQAGCLPSLAACDPAGVLASCGECLEDTATCEATSGGAACSAVDRCPEDPSKDQPGACGCGYPDVDTDGDGALDCEEDCPWDPTSTAVGVAGCAPPACSGSPADLTPVFACVNRRPGGETLGVFRVRNASACIVHVPHGADNRLTVGPTLHGDRLPTRFEPGVQATVAIPLAGEVTWRLGNRTATASPSGPPCNQDYREKLDGPIQLVASRDTASGTGPNAHGELSAPMEFEIPKVIPVAVGGAGNGSLTFSYVDAAGATVTCTYRGGSSTARPKTDLDRSLGRHYRFQSCSNGRGGGERATGTSWNVQVHGGDSQFSETQVAVTVGGCGELEPPMMPDQVTRLRQNFDWTDHPALAIADSEGLPAVHYALFYLETDEQLDALKRMGVYFRATPLFGAEWDRYRDKCGVMPPAADNQGQFVYALIPAALYNLFRDQAIRVLADGQGEVPFRAIELVPIPDPDVTNPDGTLSWQAMKASGFRLFEPSQQQALFGIDIPIIDDAIEVLTSPIAFVLNPAIAANVLLVQIGDDIVETGLSIPLTWDDIVQYGAQILEGAWNEATSILGGIDQFFSGSVRIRMDLRVINPDQKFQPGQLTRQWGKDRGADLVPTGIAAELLQDAAGFIPTRHSAVVRPNGTFEISAAKRSGVRGGGLCFQLENDAALITHALTEVEFCDFSDLEPLYDGFRHDIPASNAGGATHVAMDVNNSRFNWHAQITDGYDYSLRVLDHAPSMAEVSVGYIANAIGKMNGNRAFVGCFNFNELAGLTTPIIVDVSLAGGGWLGATQGSAPEAFTASGPFGLLSPALLARDIFLMDGPTEEGRTWTSRSRGTATHEYGHFVMCDVASQEAALHNLYTRRLLEGFGEDLDDGAGIVMESWADFFESQVVGGVNYTRPPDNLTGLAASFVASESDSYCIGFNCLESNFRGNSRGLSIEPAGDNPYLAEIGRMVTIYHDAVDGQSDWRGADVVTNADMWTFSGATLSEAPQPFAPDRDDDIQLEGPHLIDWMRGYLEASTPSAALQALGATMRAQGYDWCSICELFGQHDPTLQMKQFEGEGTSLATCSDGIDSDGDGQRDSGDIDCQLGSCRDLRDNDGDGLADYADPDCTSLQELWLECRRGELLGIVGPAPEPSGRMDAATCQPCGERETSDLSGTCVPCSPLKQYLESRNACIDCASDDVLDVATACGRGVTDLVPYSAPGDSCPGYWLDIRNLDLLTGNAGGPISVQVQGSDPLCGDLTLDVYIEGPPGLAIDPQRQYVLNGESCAGCTACAYDLTEIARLTPGAIATSGATSARVRIDVQGSSAVSVRMNTFVLTEACGVPPE